MECAILILHCLIERHSESAKTLAFSEIVCIIYVYFIAKSETGGSNK